MKTHLPPLQFYRFNAFGKAAVNHCIERFGNTPTHEQIAQATQETVLRFHPQLADPDGWIDKETTAQLMSDGEMVRDYLDWWSAGKNIFLFSEDLVQAFLRTDVEDVPTKIFQAPYRVMYFKFGQRTSIQTLSDPVRFLDGAYVSAYHGGLTVNCTQCSEDASVGSCGASFFIDLAHCEDIGDALQRGLKQQADDIHQESDPSLGTANQFWVDTEAERRAVFEHYLSVAREVTKLIINGLAYILFEKDDIREDWLGAPENLLGKLKRSTTPKERQRNESKLWANGFTKVHLCSPRLETNTPGHAGYEVDPHWRRGHWRLQPHGVGLSLLKLIWIKPTIVRRDKGEPEQGHIYQA